MEKKYVIDFSVDGHCYQTICEIEADTTDKQTTLAEKAMEKAEEFIKTMNMSGAITNLTYKVIEKT